MIKLILTKRNTIAKYYCLYIIFSKLDINLTWFSTATTILDWCNILVKPLYKYLHLEDYIYVYIYMYLHRICNHKKEIPIHHQILMPKNQHCICILTFRSKNNFWCPLWSHYNLNKIFARLILCSRVAIWIMHKICIGHSKL